MIQYGIAPATLRAAIETVDADWFDKAAALIAGLPDPPKSSDFQPLWSKIKGVYIELQHSKCCFCEKPLEGKIEQDVEHFRPKAEVKPWKVPARLLAEGIDVQQPADGSSEAGYARLAYSPFNYAMACKTCNSTLKRNFFPVEGRRAATATDPAQTKAEKALLIYPIGAADEDPEPLIAFESALAGAEEKERLRPAPGAGDHRGLSTRRQRGTPPAVQAAGLSLAAAVPGARRRGRRDDGREAPEAPGRDRQPDVSGSPLHKLHEIVHAALRLGIRRGPARSPMNA